MVLFATGSAATAAGCSSTGSNADIAGLRTGDVIALLDGRSVASPVTLAGTFNGAASGQTYLLTIRRADRTSTLIVVIP